jgi:hypothetical protein
MEETPRPNRPASNWNKNSPCHFSYAYPGCSSPSYAKQPYFPQRTSSPPLPARLPPLPAGPRAAHVAQANVQTCQPIDVPTFSYSFLYFLKKSDFNSSNHDPLTMIHPLFLNHQSAPATPLGISNPQSSGLPCLPCLHCLRRDRRHTWCSFRDCSSGCGVKSPIIQNSPQGLPARVLVPPLNLNEYRLCSLTSDAFGTSGTSDTFGTSDTKVNPQICSSIL